MHGRLILVGPDAEKGVDASAMEKGAVRAGINSDVGRQIVGRLRVQEVIGKHEHRAESVAEDFLPATEAVEVVSGRPIFPLVPGPRSLGAAARRKASSFDV